MIPGSLIRKFFLHVARQCVLMSALGQVRSKVL